jgi:hypothetical protein
MGVIPTEIDSEGYDTPQKFGLRDLIRRNFFEGSHTPRWNVAYFGLITGLIYYFCIQFSSLICKEFPEVEVDIYTIFLFILQAEEESLLKNPAAFINPDQPLISGVQLSGNGSVLRWGNECQFLCKLRRKGDSC